MARFLRAFIWTLVVITIYEAYNHRPKTFINADGMRVVYNGWTQTRTYYYRDEAGLWDRMYSIALPDTSRSSLP